MVECDSSGNDLRTTMIRKTQWIEKYLVRLNNPLKEHYLLIQESNLGQAICRERTFLNLKAKKHSRFISKFTFRQTFYCLILHLNYSSTQKIKTCWGNKS